MERSSTRSRVLLMQRSDNRLWALPGGMVEVGETAAQAAEREVWEETGVHVRAERLFGIYDNRAYGGRAPFQVYMVGFMCSYVSGTPHPTSEALAVGYFSEDALPQLTPGHRIRVPQVFAWHRGGRTEPHFEREVGPLTRLGSTCPSVPTRREAWTWRRVRVQAERVGLSCPSA